MDDKFVCYNYRHTSLGARSETIPLIVESDGVKRLKPLFEKRSRTGNHGEDCYAATQLKAADVLVHIEVSNSGRHYCSISLRRELGKEELKRIAEWLVRNEHICDMLAEQLLDLGLEEEEIVRLVRE